jgi:hypothetical protein
MMPYNCPLGLPRFRNGAAWERKGAAGAVFPAGAGAGGNLARTPTGIRVRPGPIGIPAMPFWGQGEGKGSDLRDIIIKTFIMDVYFQHINDIFNIFDNARFC